MANVVVRFGADLAPLAGGINEARASLKQFQSDISSVSQSGTSGLESIADGAAKVTGALGIAAAATSAFSKNFNFEEAGRNLKALNIGAIGQQFVDAGKGMAQMALASAAETATLVGLGIAAAGAVAGFVMLKSAVDEAYQRINAVASATAFAGNLAAIQSGTVYAADGVAQFIAALSQIPGVSADDAAAIEAMLGSTHNYSQEMNKLVIDILPAYAAASGQKLPDAMSKLASAIDDPLNKVKSFAATLPNVSTAETAQAEAAARSGNVNQALATIMALLAGRYAQAKTQMAPLTAAHRDMAESAAEAAAAEAGLDISLDITATKLNYENTSIEQNVAKWKERIDALRQAAQTPEQLKFESGKIVDQVNPVSSQMDQLQSKIDEVSQHLNGLKTNWQDFTTARDGSSFEKDVQRDTEALAKMQSQMVQLRQQQAGGSPVQLVDLSSLQQSVTLGQDALRDARAKAEAAAQEVRQLQAALGPGQTSVELTNKQTEAARALLSVRMQEVDLQKAKNALGKANSDDTSGTAAVAEAKANASAISQAYGKGTQQRIEAETAVVNAQKQLDAESQADAATAENAAYEHSKSLSDRRIEDLKEQVSTHQISAAQGTAAEIAALDQQQDATQDHFAKLREIRDEGSKQYRAITLDETKADDELAAKQEQIYRDANKQVLQSYTQTFERVGSTVSSNIMQMIQGQEKFGAAVKNVATSIVESMLQAGVKMAADWLAKQAMQLAATVTGQASQTSAVAAGEAARSGLVAAGAATQQTSIFSSMITTILADAKATIAGVTAFLSPIMGPAAPAAGAAAGAEVAALASFDIGAYQIPADQIAMVHRNELVMPAAEAGAFRSMLSGMTGGNSQGGGDTHYHDWGGIHLHGVSGKSADLEKSVHSAIKSLIHRNGFAGYKPRFS